MAYNWTTLSGLKTVAGSIANWVNRGDLPGENILIEAQAWILQWLRVREMAVQTAFQFDISTSSKALPADFLDPVAYVPYGWGDPLDYREPTFFEQPRDENGTLYTDTPSQWTIIGTTAQVNVTCVANFGGILTYFGKPDDLSAANETNFLTSRYPTLLRRACLARAYEHMKEYAEMKDEEAMAMAAIQEANATNALVWRGARTPF